MAPILERLGYKLERAKTNIGLGQIVQPAGRACQGDCKRMTNTLHRFGDAESFHDDYIVFAIPSKSNKDPNALPKLHRFLEIAHGV